MDGTPVLDMLLAYERRQDVRFHMPGHKGRALPESWRDVVRLDVTELDVTDDLRRPKGAFLQAQALAAAYFSCAETFFLTGGSSSGIAAMVLGLLSPGDEMIVPRDAHRCVSDALILSGANPVWIMPEADEGERLYACVTPQQVQGALQAHPQAKAVLLAAPDYYGRMPDVREIARVTHESGALLLVDSAHGAHLGACPAVPPSVGTLGADAWVAGAHKTMGALTGSAFLNVNSGIEAERIARAIRLVETSSPSFLMAASLDWTRAYFQHSGREQVDALARQCQSVNRHVSAAGILCPQQDWKRRGLCFDIDDTRLVFDVAASGIAGSMAADVLSAGGIQVEFFDERRIVCLTSVHNSRYDFERLENAMEALARASRLFEPIETAGAMIAALPQVAIPMREAWFANKVSMPLAEAEGRVAAEAAGLYPPGIPVVVPGEIIEAGHIEILEKAWQEGVCFGISDGLPVIVEEGKS
ncbi:MAG: aminotransferase class I/II-fold pyridoxal phosphate-dependent enzyme [Christensenellales bacterium]|jgi:arginine/lysine/ornithine decarboxylase